MFTMSLTALFTALGAEVMSRSEDAFELDRLSTVILSQEYTVLLTPLKYLKILKKWKKCEDFQQRNLFVIEMLVPFLYEFLFVFE